MAKPATAAAPPSSAATHPLPHLIPLSQSISISQQLRDPNNTTQNNQQQFKLYQPQIKSLPTKNPPPPPTSSSSPPSMPSLPITELQSISAALSAFQNSFIDLQHHLNTLKTAIDNLIAIPTMQRSQLAPFPSSAPGSLQESSPPTVPTAPPNPTTEAPSYKIVEKNFTEATATATAVVAGEIEDKSIGLSIPELRSYCELMNSKGLKKYLVTNLKEISKLREEVPKALKYAPNPARLVLECSGRFFLQGSKAYVKKDSPMVTGREASVLILECFLLMEIGENGFQIEKSVKEEADQAVMMWRKRMVSEGGVMKACEIDARGLLLFIGCFGLPPMFKNNDLRDLLRISNVREMAGTVRRSTVLMKKVPEIIDGMIKNKLEVDAVDVAYTFGCEDKFNAQRVLTPLLQQFEESWKKGKKTPQASPAAVNEASRKQLGVLKSILKCLEAHKIDSSKIFGGMEVNEKILSLERIIGEYEKKRGAERAQKRKAESQRRTKLQDMKRSRYTSQALQQQNVVGHDSQRNSLDTGLTGHISGYSASSSMLHQPVGGAGPYAGAYGGMVVDPAGHVMNHSGQPYGWHGDPTLPERVVAHSYAAQPSSSSINGLYRRLPSLEGYAMHPTASSVAVPSRGTVSDLYQFADAVNENEYHPSAASTHHSSYLYRT